MDHLILDLDMTMFVTLPQMIDYVNERFGIHSVPADYIGNPGFHEVVRKYTNDFNYMTEDEIYYDHVVNFLCSHELHKSVEPFPEMQRVVEELAKKYCLHVATARSVEGRDVIHALFTRHIPECVTFLHCVHRHIGSYKFHESSKREYIQGFKGNKVGFIDDSKKEILENQDIIPSFLFDPESLHVDHQVTQKFRTWIDIGNTFL